MALVQKVAQKFKRVYPKEEQLLQVEMVWTGNDAKTSASLDGLKLASEDGTDVIVVRPSLFSTSRLAPYSTWEDFVGRARSNWETWKKVVDWREVSRVGVRFINRIDIPCPPKTTIEIDDYLTISVKLPDPKWVHGPYAIQIALPQNDGTDVLVNSVTVPSPLIDHVSVVLDLDFSRQDNLPLRDDVLWELIDGMRKTKNTMFEHFITDKARALFQ